MKRFPAVCILLLTLCVAAFAQGQNDDLARHLKAAVTQVTSLTADFTQVRESHMFSEKLVSNGKMWLYSGKVRWEYVNPVKRVSISDGSRFLKIPESDFGLNAYEVDSSMDGVRYVLEIKPLRRDMKAMFEVAFLSFDASKGLKGVELRQASGDKTVLTFSHVKDGAEIDPSLFQ